MEEAVVERLLHVAVPAFVADVDVFQFLAVY